MISALTPIILSLFITATYSAPLNTADARPIPPRQYTSNTYNQLTDGTPCRHISLIYARGINEPGNIGGPGDLGPRFLDELAALVGSNHTEEVAVQGVNYAATYFGLLLGGDPYGSTVMKRLITSVSFSCEGDFESFSRSDGLGLF